MRTVCRAYDPKSFYQQIFRWLNDDLALGLELFDVLPVKVIPYHLGPCGGNKVRSHRTLNSKTPQAFEEHFQSNFIGK